MRKKKDEQTRAAPSGAAINFQMNLLVSGGPYKERKHPRAGELCQRCGKAVLDYDGLLNLACDRCGYSLSGGFT